MNYLKSEYFRYKQDNSLYCEETSVKEIIKKTGTPVYVYSKKFFEDRYKEFTNAFRDIKHRVFYSVKANFNINVIKIFYNLGSGIDVNSEGEFFRASKAGVNPKNMLMTGVGKTSDEIRLALEKDMLMIKAESREEIYLINEIAGKMRVRAHVAIRVNPDVNPQTHPYISTGLSQNKFGISVEEASEIFKDFEKFNHISFTGIDMHIGSQITSVEPFAEAVRKLSEFYFKVKSYGVKIKHFDIGGGIGVSYDGEKSFGLTEYAEAIIPELKKLDCEIFFEPGRFLTANGGILVTKVLYNKKNNLKNFIIVDAAMNDLLRPSIYSAYHHIQPVDISTTDKDIIADVVGPVCESGDFIAKDRTVTETRAGEYLTVMSAGAYGMVMSSNYNARRRPAEVLVDGNKFKIIRSRETFDHLLYDEIL
ncbi:MAG: diaminopimelate decarboxylase [Ignavibacteriales bacterium]|nr:MAG: diaminopimelate decarboxylase [Ignavibacteriales bacterium]